MLAAVLVLHIVHALTTTSLGRERWEIAESVLILALILAVGIFALGRWRDLVRETTERERAEDALRESEERYRTSVENMLDCFGIYSAVRDQSGHIVDFLVEYVNEAACRNNLMSKEQQIGKRLLELLPAHRETGLFHDYYRLVQTGEPLAKEQLVYEDVYGSQRLSRAFDVRAVRLGDGFAAAWRDVTERKRAQEALREETERLLKAQRVAKMGFLDWNLKTNDMTWSDQIYDLYGVDKRANESNIDLTMQLVHPDDLEFVKANLEMAIKGEKEYDIDHRMLRSDGKVIWIHAQAELVRDADGNPESLLGTVVDITERKLAEEALHKAREELEGKVERQMLRRNPYGLTFREFTVLHLVAAGRSDREIGVTLSISHLTAQKHISNILAKMHASSRTEAGVRAVREGLLE